MRITSKKSTLSVPSPALALGAAGALPFVGLAALCFPLYEYARPFAALSLQIYGAVILSFLGGIQWGLGIAAYGRNDSGPSFAHLGVSVLPAFAAWTAVIISLREGFLVLAAAFVAQLFVDLRTTKLGIAPVWYPALRLPLTAVVAPSLLAAYVGLSL